MESYLVLNHAKTYPYLPEINVSDHSIMQKGNILNKKAVLQRILVRRRKEIVIEMQLEEGHGEGYAQLPDGIFPDEHGVNELKDEQHGVSIRAYSIME